jgi:hypothetical protein
MGNIKNIMTGDGIPPVFTASDMAILKKRAEAATVINIPNQARGYTKGAYDIKAFNFMQSYKRGETPWALMNKNQRDWLWKIKDSLKGR